MLNSVVVYNIPFNKSSKDVKEWVDKAVSSVHVKILVNSLTARSIGQAEATFSSVTEAAEAVTKLNGSELGGNKIRVLQLD